MDRLRFSFVMTSHRKRELFRNSAESVGYGRQEDIDGSVYSITYFVPGWTGEKEAL